MGGDDRWQRRGCCVGGLELFDEVDVECVEYVVGRSVPQAVSLGIGCVTDEHARARAVEDLRVVSRYQGESTTSDFPEMRERGAMPIPQFKGCLTIVGGGSSEVR